MANMQTAAETKKQKLSRKAMQELLLEKTWLPAEGDTRKRINDLLKGTKISQAKLAQDIDIDRTTLSRFISGQTDTMSQETVIKIAEYFDVTTDFVLGLIDDPARTNYDISELGLTVKAAQNLYTGKVNTEVLCRLLENDYCGQLMRHIGLALIRSWQTGVAAQNQFLTSFGDYLYGLAKEKDMDEQTARSIVSDLNAYKLSSFNQDRYMVEQDINHMLNTMADKENPQKAALLTKNTLADIFANNKKGYNLLNPMESNPEKWVDSILMNIDMTDAPKDLREQMEDVLPKLKDIFVEYIMIVREMRKRIA